MREFLSLDIGFHNIKLAVGSVFGASQRITEALVFETPENAIEDGKILAPELLAAVIKEQLAKHGIKTKDAVLSINGTAIISREVIMPKVKEKEIRNIIEMESDQYFPVSLDNYAVDFKVIEEITGNGKSQYKVLVVAIPAQMIEKYLELANLCGLNLVKIDYAGNSINKLVNKEYFTSKKGQNTKDLDTIAIVDMGSRTTTVTILSKGILQFSRIIFYGGSSMTNSIADRLNILYDEAERKKKSLSKIIDSADEDSAGKEDVQISNSIKSVALILIDDMSKYFEFYNSRGTGNKIDTICLTGGSSEISGLDNYLSNAFSIPVIKLKMPQSIQYKNRENKAGIDYKYFSVCLGALLEK